MSKIFKAGVHDGKTTYHFDCPGCGIGHSFRTPDWTIVNDDLRFPTIRPSILLHKIDKVFENSNGTLGHRCHSFITDGQIKFLNDCTHPMKNMIVPLEDFKE
jgi:hypothetical protein